MSLLERMSLTHTKNEGSERKEILGDLELLANVPLALPTSGRSRMGKGSKSLSSTKGHGKKDFYFEVGLKMMTEMKNLASRFQEDSSYTLAFAQDRSPGPGRVSGLGKLMV